MTSPAARSAPRSRRAVRPTGDDREAAILATAESLLAERSLAEISVDDLASGAGISRPTFYFYFASKEAVLLALVDRVVAETNARLVSVGQPGTGTREMWPAYLSMVFETFRRHRAVTLAGSAVLTHHHAARELWSSVMSSWVDWTEEAITTERACGAAPDGVPARELAVLLNTLNERTIQRSLAGEQPCLPEERVVDALVGTWLTMIYGAP